jgi:hypothetical protein
MRFTAPAKCLRQMKYQSGKTIELRSLIMFTHNCLCGREIGQKMALDRFLGKTILCLINIWCCKRLECESNRAFK